MSQAARHTDSPDDLIVTRRREKLRHDAGYKARLTLIRRQIESGTLPPPTTVEGLKALKAKFEQLK